MFALGIGLAAIAFVCLVFMVLYFANPDRMKDLLATVSMAARSWAESKARAKGKGKHRRRTDPPDVVHEHARRPSRPSMLMTIRAWATPPRSSDPRQRSTDHTRGVDE